jgi:hypothetical protein
MRHSRDSAAIEVRFVGIQHRLVEVVLVPETEPVVECKMVTLVMTFLIGARTATYSSQANVPDLHFSVIYIQESSSLGWRIMLVS